MSTMQIQRILSFSVATFADAFRSSIPWSRLIAKDTRKKSIFQLVWLPKRNVIVLGIHCSLPRPGMAPTSGKCCSKGGILGQEK